VSCELSLLPVRLVTFRLLLQRELVFSRLFVFEFGLPLPIAAIRLVESSEVGELRSSDSRDLWTHEKL
jgi:hypothetical protein